MTKKHLYRTDGRTCSRAIEVELEDDVVRGVRFEGGCAGNTQGVARMVNGLRIEEVIARLEGIDCKGRGTSCPDQLCRALREAMAE